MFFGIWVFNLHFFLFFFHFWIWDLLILPRSFLGERGEKGFCLSSLRGGEGRGA